MNTNIKYLKDESGNTISPVTNIRSIFNDNGISILDLFYPVGSYYETSDESFNPNTTWGGTWVQDTKGLTTIATNNTEATQAISISTGEVKGYAKNRLNAAIGAYRGNTGSIGYAATSKVPNVNYTYGISSNSDASIPYDDINHATLVYDVTDKNNVTPNPTYLQPSIGVIRWHRTA